MSDPTPGAACLRTTGDDLPDSSNLASQPIPIPAHHSNEQQQQQQNQQRLNHGQDNDHEYLVPRSLPSSLPSLAAVLVDAGHAHPNNCGSNGDRHTHETDQEQGQHTRSKSQPALGLGQPSSPAPLLHRRTGSGCGGCYSRRTSADATHCTDCSRTGLRRTIANNTRDRSSVDLSSFLDFAISATGLVESLHARGLAHGQLGPGSFQWQPSGCGSGLLTADLALPANNNNNNYNNNNNNSSGSGSNNNRGHPQRRENYTSPGRLSVDRAGSSTSSPMIAQNIDDNSSHSSQSNSRAMPIRKQPHTGDSSVPPRRASQPSQERPFSLSLDCTHLGLGDLANTATAPIPAATDTNGVSPSGARGGLRDSQPTMATFPHLTGSDSVATHSPSDQETGVCTHMGRSNNHTHAASLSSSVGSAKPNCSCCSRSDSADGAGSAASGTGIGAPTTSAAAAAAAAAATTTTMTTTTTATATATTSMTTTSTTTTTTVLQEGFAARVARFKRSFMPLAVAFASPGGSSSSSQSSLLTPSTAATAGGPRSPMVHAAGNRSTPSFFMPCQYQHQHQHRQPTLPLYHPTAAPFSNGTSTVTVSKKHFLLNIPTELYPRPGGPPSIQVDIYSLGVMFYYMMTTHSALLPSPEDGPPMAGAGGAAATPVGSNGITPPIRKDAYLPTTPTRLANIIQKMISIGKDSFTTMALVRNELVSVRDQEQEASKKEAELKELATNPMDKSAGEFSGLSSLSPYSTSLPRATSSSNSIQSTASSSTTNTVHGLEQPSEQQESSPITAPIATMRPPFMNMSLSTPSPALPSISSSSSSTKSTLSSCTDSLSLEDQVFILESVLSLGHIPNLQEMLRAISVALDSILVVHPPEEMAIILWQKDERSTDGGGSWAIIEDKFQPGDNGQSTLIWTDLAERRDQMPVLVKKALDSREPVFSTAVGSRSQLPTIACLPIIATNPTIITGSATVTATNPASLGINQEDNLSSTSLSSSSGTKPTTTTATATTTSTATTTTTLVGAIYLHHLHPRFYFSKRDRDMLMLFCQKLANPLLNCDRISILERNVALATQRSRFLEDTFTRIQKTEHEVLSWMEALPCYVWAAERDDVSSRRYLSGSWFGYTGLPHDSRMSDLWLSKMHPDDVAAFQKEVSQSYKTGVYKDCEFRLMRKDGVYRWHLSRAVPVLNQYGAVIKWIGVTIDIDDLYSAQKAELHKKSNFLANMSHELRTPFSGFHGMLSLLGYSNLDEEQQECVQTAKTSCEKLLLIIDDLLDFSKLEADKVTLEASSFDLEEVFDEVEDIVEPLAKQKSLEMAFIKAENVPEVLIGDCNRLKQILLNLVGNAIKFTHSGHVIVKCKVLDRDFDMANLSSEGSMAGEWEDDDDKFYFRHEKNGGGQCRSENRPPNSGRFSSPEPLSETSIKLMFSVEDTGIGINSEEQAVLFSPFSQVDGSATRSYGGSGLGLSICLQLVKLMKGRIGLNSQRGRGSTFWFVVQCEQSSALPEGSIRDMSDTEVPEPTKEIKRITRTMGKPRILIASNSETTVKALQTFRTDFNTEIADQPSIAASRLDESVANGLRFDFVCWDFPSLDPNHEIMLELNARPDLLNVHFVLLYSNTNTDMIRRAQSLQLPSSSSSPGSSAPPLSVGAKRRPMASQPISLRKENTFNGSSRLHSSNSTGRRSPMFCDPPVSIPPTIGSVVPGLSPEMLSSLRITYISKPVRRLKLLRAFVEILDDSARIHGAQAVKKGSVGSSTSTASSGPSNTVTSTPTVLSPTSPTTSSVSGTSASLTAMASPISSPTTVSASSSSSALHSKNSSTTTVSSPVSLPPMSASMLTTLENALGLENQDFKDSNYDQILGANDYNYKNDVLQRPLEDYELGIASGVYKKDVGDHATADKIETEVFPRDLGSATVTPRQQQPLVDSIDPTEVSGYHDKETGRKNLDQVGCHGQQQANGGTDTIILTVQDPSPTSVDSSVTGTEDRAASPQTPEQHLQSTLHVKQQLKKAKSQELKVPESRPAPLKNLSRSTTPSPASLGGSNGGLGGLCLNIKSRSNSPKPTKTSKLVTEEKSETSLSLEEAERISGMRILLAEDNEIAQKVLSRQLAMFGLVISCANDGMQALELFKAHPRGYYALGFFDHHMPNCDGVQATQQIRVLEREHATAVKGPVPRLPVVAVSADIQETARRACLNSGMERYVTKPLMQKDLVEIVRRYCVEGDAEASTLAYDPPPEGSEDLSQDVGGSVLGVPTTAEAMASGCLVSAPIGGGSAMSTPILLSMNQMPGPGTTGAGATGNKSPTPKSASKRDMGLSPAALRGLALINESNKMDESAKVGGGGDMHQMATTTFPTPPAITSTASSMISPPMQHSMSHQGIITGNSYQNIHHHQHQHHHHQHHYQQYLQSQGGGLNTLHKSSSSSSLYASYHQGLVVTPKPIATTGSEASTAKSPAQGPSPIAAMAAGAAAAAVAVASAAVNTVSSAINEHIHPPSLYAAQVTGSGACSTWKNILVNSSIGTAPTANVLDLSVGKGMTESGYRYEQEYIETQKQQLVDILSQEQQQQQQHQHAFDSYNDDDCCCQPPLDGPESFTQTDEEASMMALAHEAKTIVSPMAMLVPEAVGDSAVAPIENWV